MDIMDAIYKVNQAFPNIFNRPSDLYNSTENTFHDLVIKNLDDPKFRNVTIDPDTEEVDLAWLTFLWWVYSGDAVRINDSLHGFFWSASKDDALSHSLDDNCRFRQLLAEDPIVQAEYAKVEDYIKHIRWIFHKTQNLPNITIIGRGNVPERLHGLRQARITVLGAEEKLPVKTMFSDFGQRRRFRVIDPYDVTDVLNSKDYKMYCTQNVVIFDDYHISLNENLLKEKIMEAGCYLTEHGRVLFDLPMYDHGEIRMQSNLYRLIRPFIPASDEGALLSPNDINAIDDYVHGVIKWINESEYMERNGWMFKIEEIKLTDAGLRNSIAARVYLKKCLT